PILQHIFAYSSDHTLSITSQVCSLWNVHAKDVAERRTRKFRTLFPYLHKLYSQTKQAALYEKIGRPINWESKYAQEIVGCTSSLTPAQQQDYLILRSGDLDGVKKILSSTDGLKRIFLRDAQNAYIFDFLRTFENRQAILDAIFIAASKDYKIDDQWVFKSEFCSVFDQKYGIKYLEFTQLGKNQTSFLILFAALCNQVALLKQWAIENTIDKDAVAMLASIAIQFDYETVFAVLEESGLMKDCQIDDVVIAINRRQTRLILPKSQTFANRIFDHLCKCYQLPNELWERKANGKYGVGLFAWAVILKQMEFLDNNIGDVPDKSHSYHYARTFFKLNASFHQLILKFLIGKGMTLIDEPSQACCLRDKSHPLYRLIEDGDLVTLIEVLNSQIKDRKLLQEYALELAILSGNLDSVKFVFSLFSSQDPVDYSKVSGLIEKSDHTAETKKEMQVMLNETPFFHNKHELSLSYNYKRFCPIL
ncbi:MAG: hypothetical protein ABL857_06855, partial [Rickettsiales bacterium]